MREAQLLGVWGIRPDEEFSFPLMKYWFRHYSDCGVRPHNMHITIFTNDYDFAGPFKSWIAEFGVEDIEIKSSERFDFFEATEERKQLQRRINPDDWFINPDMDELVAFTDSVPNLTNWLKRKGYNYIDGDIQDRFARNFVLKPIIDDLPLHLQFPVIFDFTNSVLGANPRKVTMALNRYSIELGCHWLSNESGVAFKYSPLRFHIDHYKWDAGLKKRCERLKAHVQKYSDEDVHWKGEYEMLLDCIEGDRINVHKYHAKMLREPD